LNRLRVGVGWTKENMRKWGYGDQDITAKPTNTRGSYDEQPEGGKYSYILDKRKYIINMQCILSYSLPLY